MEVDKDIGGAQALLQLGSKANEDEPSGGDVVHEDQNDLVVHESEEAGDDHHVTGRDDDKDQELNDAVEAAVMKYVGGTLNSGSGDNGHNIHHMKLRRLPGESNNRDDPDVHNDPNHDPELESEHAKALRRRKLANEEFMNDIDLWAFLHDNVADSRDNDVNVNFDQTSQLTNSDGGKRKRRRKTGDDFRDSSLLNLESQEHEDLVRAAIMDVRALEWSHQQTPEHATNDDEAMAQVASQAVASVTAAAAAAAAEAAELEKKLSIHLQQQQQQQQQHQHQQQHQQQQQRKRGRKRQKLDEEEEAKSLTREWPNLTPLTTEEDLVIAAGQITHEWFDQTILSEGEMEVEELEKLDPQRKKDLFKKLGPRYFTPLEIEAVDYFILGYCHLKELTREEICARVWTHGRLKDTFWINLTRVFPYRSRASVYKHVKRQYHVYNIRGTWTKEDDNLLGELVQSRPGNWKSIGETMGRMPEDCRDRWRNYLKCGDNRTLDRWTKEEEDKLLKAVVEILSKLKTDINFRDYDKNKLLNWTVVSEKMDGRRSRIQCRYKWRKLVKREQNELAQLMSLPHKVWMFDILLQSEYTLLDKVDWSKIADERPFEPRNELQLLLTRLDQGEAYRIAFERLTQKKRKTSPRLEFKELISKVRELCIANEFHYESNDRHPGTRKKSNMSDDTEEKNGQDSVEDAASIANAAVAAVLKNGLE
ncbi:RNA polymerase I enhancer binding protein [Scheffersomyces spartinae]|uniref:RNA polymerase I enhancer binding protein n=1 Tax=Scheffersomyces spartinae TaxID=45513 RepID=A0A9P8AI87_9ASCO|nr:RNA polymerase I enhancer binding protein [Scheffersomyces spartinae]KAG7193603.1 RNA polymerase I enhancer binding protein [Scheffersomyces spartinae]